MTLEWAKLGKKYLDESGEDDIDYIEVNDLKERVKLGVRKTERVETRLRLGEGKIVMLRFVGRVEIRNQFN